MKWMSLNMKSEFEIIQEGEDCSLLESKMRRLHQLTYSMLFTIL